MRRSWNEGRLQCMRRTGLTAIVAIFATPAISMGMQCSEYIKYIELDMPASMMFDFDALGEFATTHGVLIGISMGIEATRPDLSGISDRTLEYCRGSLNADAFDFIKSEIER